MSKKIVRNIFENVNDENIALTSEISTKLSYKGLKLFIDKISKQLAGNGLSNKDRAAIVLPNGPYMASSFLAISFCRSPFSILRFFKRLDICDVDIIYT